MDATAALTQVLTGLILVLVLMGALALVYSRLARHRSTGSNDSLRLRASLSLGRSERLVVVDYGGQRLLLGVTVGSVTPLAVTDAPEPADEPTDRLTGALTWLVRPETHP